MKTIQIAIDGPASSGKSTVARRVAQILDIVYLDSGALYRGVTYAALERDIDISQEHDIQMILDQLDFELLPQNDGSLLIMLNGNDISQEIRSNEVTQNVSEVSSYLSVREYVNQILNHLSHNHSVIMDGRDIGTMVLPNATYKFYLTASVEERARRRYKDNQERGIVGQTLEEIKHDIQRRDEYDSTRKISPLTKAADAIEIDTSKMTIDEVVNEIIKKII